MAVMIVMVKVMAMMVIVMVAEWLTGYCSSGIMIVIVGSGEEIDG